MKLRYVLHLSIPFWITGLLLTSAWLANRLIDNRHSSQNGQPLLAAAVAQLDNPTAQRYFYHETFATQQAKADAVDVHWDSIAHQLTLALRHNQPQQDAIVATDGAQHRYVIWQDLRNDSGDIYAQSLDTAGNPIWPTDRLVNQVMTDTLQAAPAAIVDGAGNLIVAWVDQRNGQSDIYAQKLNPKGDSVWLEDIRIHQESGNTDQDAPVLAMRADGSVVIVWHDNRNGDYDVFAQQIDGEGVRQWEADVRVNRDASAQSQAEPTVRIVAPNQALVVWLDQRIGNLDLYAQGLTSSGQHLWSQDLRINPATDSAQTRPALAGLTTGETLVAWVGASGDHIAVQKVSMAGALLWPVPKSVQLSGQIVDTETAPGLLTLGNTVIIAWRVPPEDQLYAQRLDAQGVEQWANPVRITQPGSSLALLRQIWPGVMDGEAVLFAWPAVRNNGQQGVYSQQLNPDGSLAWAEEGRISAASGTVDQRAPALAVSADGHAVVAWQDGRATVPALYAQRIAPDGQLLWPDQVRVQQRTITTTAQSIPAVAMVQEDLGVAWAEERNGQKRIYTQRLDRLGYRLGADVRASSRAQIGSDSQLNPALAASPGNTVVAWEEWRGEQRLILAQRINSEGNPQWPADVVVSDPATNARFPALAVDAAGYTTLVWSVSTTDQTDLFSQRLDPNGKQVWAQPIRVNYFAGLVDPLNPAAIAVASSAAQQSDATVVWVDRRQGDVYAQRLSATGQPVWAQDIALSTPPRAGIPNPTVAMAVDGSAVIAWQGIGSGGRQTILAQRLDNTGRAQWQSAGAPALLVSAAIRTGSHPRVAIDGSGNSVIAWQEQRQMNPDVYVQRLDANGNRLWAADRLVVSADHFYVTQGRVRSWPIDTVEASIPQALLTAHLNRQGGEIDFQLSNDNGAHWATVQPGISHLFTTTGSALRWQAILSTPAHHLQTTPVLREVTIEYTADVMLAGDAYETDNSCADARPLLINSATQAHTLLATPPLDEDWLQLAVAANQTYTLIVNAQAYDPALTAAVYASCSGQAMAAQTGHDGTALYVSFTSSLTATYYIRIGYTHNGATQSALAYEVRLQQDKAPGLAIIVAGALANQDPQQAFINTAANHAYLTLFRHGYAADQIDYLNPLLAQDVDGNHVHDDVDAIPTLPELYAALQQAEVLSLGPDVPLLIYLVGRFTGDEFFLNDQQTLTSATLERWLANLESTTSINQITVVLEGSYTGSWIDPQAPPVDDLLTAQRWSVSGPNRTVIASTNPGAAAWPSAHGLLFSDSFWTALSMGYNLHQSFQIGQTMGQTAGCIWPNTPTLCQTPWLDDSGKGQPNQAQDRRFATNWSLASPNRSVPQIINVSITRAQVGEGLTITAAVLNSTQLSQLAAHLVRPDVQPVWLPNAFPTLDPTVVALNQPLGKTADVAGVVVYTGLYTQPVPPNTMVIVYGRDAQNLPILPHALRVDSERLIYLPVIQK